MDQAQKDVLQQEYRRLLDAREELIAGLSGPLGTAAERRTWADSLISGALQQLQRMSEDDEVADFARAAHDLVNNLIDGVRGLRFGRRENGDDDTNPTEC